MNLDDRARSATEALRRRAGAVDADAVFDRIVAAPRRRRRWIAVTAVAGAAVVLALVVVPGLFAPTVSIDPMAPGDQDDGTLVDPDVDGTDGTASGDDAAAGGEACSAASLPPDPAEQEGLPRPVAEMRQAIAEGAVACDVERLEELASGGFTHSFGDDGDPGAHWRRLEEQGERPLWYLRQLLDVPHAIVETHADPDAPDEHTTIYVWPSAHGDDAGSDDLRLLVDAGLYTEEDLEAWERFGGYTGYRVGITADGEWLHFVAGD